MLTCCFHTMNDQANMVFLNIQTEFCSIHQSFFRLPLFLLFVWYMGYLYILNNNTIRCNLNLLELPPRLALVTGVREVGAPLCGGAASGTRVYGIKRVAFLPLSPQPLDAAVLAALGLHPCKKHNSATIR